MRHRILKVLARCSLAILFVLAGYMLAVLSFSRVDWIDARSGARRTTFSIYPFSVSDKQSNDAFWVLFGNSSADDGEGPEWVEIASERFLDPRRLVAEVERITQGESLARSENRLVGHLLQKEIDRAERHRLSERFYRALRVDGVPGASGYVNDLLTQEADQRIRAKHAEEARASAAKSSAEGAKSDVKEGPQPAGAPR